MNADAVLVVALFWVVAVLMVAVTLAAWSLAPRVLAVMMRRRPRHRFSRTGPGAQYWVRSPAMVITAEYDIVEGEATS
ncbi:hypothetical protein AB0B28_08315 [Glycomyces sp. NPDC046736]|uniref:hypothetical protein n=1 Tax=Glycomyces sp. NPDC046736 TaxID=3155615 RepID=UPI0033F59B5E